MNESVEFKNDDVDVPPEKREICVVKPAEEVVTIEQLEDEIRGHRATAKGHSKLADEKEAYVEKLKDALGV